MLFCRDIETPLARMRMASDGQALTALRFLTDSEPPLKKQDELTVFRQTRLWLEIYFSGRDPEFTPPLAMKGTPFRLAVWEKLREIPYGKTVTYGQLAREIAGERGKSAMSAQAVGGAVGHNPILIIVPCHRVIGSDGSLVGFSAGTELKEKLLRREGALRQEKAATIKSKYLR